MLPSEVLDAIERHLGRSVDSATPVGGGCISHASRVTTADGKYFLKWSDGLPGDTFAAEAKGLEELSGARHDLHIPAVIFVRSRSSGEAGILLLEWLDDGAIDATFWQGFGADLAALHRNVSQRYGFSEDNYIGRLRQRNPWCDQWPDFFRTNRLEPQAADLRGRGAWQRQWTEPYDRLLIRLDDLLPRDPGASLVHGDLWSGNFMAHASGKAALIDPAAYYGHREVDLAMTELFGGFNAAFYTAYRDNWCLEAGYEERRSVYNLYHLFNHVNHFGASYASAVAGILKRF